MGSRAVETLAALGSQLTNKFCSFSTPFEADNNQVASLAVEQLRAFVPCRPERSGQHRCSAERPGASLEGTNLGQSNFGQSICGQSIFGQSIWICMYVCVMVGPRGWGPNPLGALFSSPTPCLLFCISHNSPRTPNVHISRAPALQNTGVIV